MDVPRMLPSPRAQHRRFYESNGGSDVEVVCDHPAKGSSFERLEEAAAAEGIVWGGLRRKRVSWLYKLLILVLILSASLSLLIALFMTFPHSEIHIEAGAAKDSTSVLLLKIPRNMDELRMVRRTVGLYHVKFPRRVAFAFAALYLFVQTFIIPGSLLLAILAGSMFGFYQGLVLVTVAGTAGASCCYLLSQAILKDIVIYYFPHRCEWLSHEVHRHRENLLSYILCLRIVPIVPSWFVNVAAPIVGVPFRAFVMGTLVGNIPVTVVCVKAGGIVARISSVHDLYDAQTALVLAAMAATALIPVALKGRCLSRGAHHT